MESTRQQKISKLLQKELSDVLQVEGRNIYGTAMVTVTRVEISRDCSYARVYLSIYATKDKKAVFAIVEHNNKEIRFKLGQRIKNQMRVIPELNFIYDDTLDYLENIDNLLKK